MYWNLPQESVMMLEACVDVKVRFASATLAPPDSLHCVVRKQLPPKYLEAVLRSKR